MARGVVRHFAGMDPAPFGSLLKTWRVAAGLSQADLAAAAGVTRQQVIRWEAGAAITSRNMARVMAPLGVAMPGGQRGLAAELADVNARLERIEELLRGVVGHDEFEAAARRVRDVGRRAGAAVKAKGQLVEERERDAESGG